MADPFELKRFNLDLAFPFKSQYGNYIGGQWLAPSAGRYFDNLSPITGKPFTKIPQSDEEDVNRALDAAHAAQVKWGKTSAAERSNLLLKIADRIEQNLQTLAVAETIDNGKPLRETMAADLPLAVDHFRYFAGCLRAEEGTISEIDEYTVAYHFQEPIGVVGQIIPWNFPLLMATWKLAPALAAGNCIVLKPAEQTPATILLFMELLADVLPPGVINVVNGFGHEAGAALTGSDRISKLAFTGSTEIGKVIAKAAADKIIPVTLELGGKSPNVFFNSIMQEDDNFRAKAVEGLAMFALNQGEICTCPSRALVQEDIADEFIDLAVARVKSIKRGNPLDTDTMVGAQASQEQMDKISGFLESGPAEGAELLTGGKIDKVDGLDGGFYIEPTIFRGDQSMNIFQEEIFGPVLSLTTFKDYDDAMRMANDTQYGLGAGVWTRDTNEVYRAGREIQSGRVWVNCYHQYPAHAAFGGYKKSGVGRENHLMMLSHYQQTKNMLVSYSSDPTGLF